MWLAMREVKRAMREIIDQVQKASDELDSKQVNGFIKVLRDSKRIFVIGAGRSGIVARAFAMRLMHLGFDTHVIGETITPAVSKEDLLVGVSGSGETSLVVNAAKIAKNIGAKVAVITSYPDSSLARTADQVVVLPGRTWTAATTDFVQRQIAGEYESLTPMGTLFEATALVFLDGVIASLMNKLGKKEEELRARHATIE
jgi:6-phospho 3-hexuloisomerase